MEISVESIPSGSKLILNGDWYQNRGGGWHIACYFVDDRGKAFRQGVPVDLLPYLVPGTIYPIVRGHRETSGYTGVFSLPPFSQWEKFAYSQIPQSLKRLHDYSDQIDNQYIFRIPLQEKVYWLPIIELARMLLFHSSEVVRAAVYQGNTWQLAKADKSGWKGKVRFTSNVPVGYVNRVSFRKFFSWLLFDSNVEESFASIFENINANSMVSESHERWTFDFKPPELASCEISWSGFTGREAVGEEHHCYIREIRSIAGIPAPQVMSVEFSHPDDMHYFTKENESNDDHEDMNTETLVSPHRIDMFATPSAGRRRHLLHISSSGLHFDAEIDLQREQRPVRQLPIGQRTDNLKQIKETVGFLESSDNGLIPRADFDNLEEPSYLDASEKFFLFQSMLEQIRETEGWDVRIEFGIVPQQRCRSLHLLDNRPRKYLYASIRLDESTEICCLEIELGKGECLSTLCYRSTGGRSVREEILKALMTNDSSTNQKAMQWDRSINTRLTSSRFYLEHPDQKVLAVGEALESWMVRATDKFLSL